MRSILCSLCALALIACSNTNTGRPGMADMDIVARDDAFALVRLKSGQQVDDLAHVFLGHAAEAGQILEINGATNPVAGDVLAVPLRPVNPSAVYTNGYRVLPVLCYHQFTESTRASHQLELSAAAFEQQLKYLVDNDFVLLSLREVENILRGERSIPEKAAVITIDDGYRSVYDVAWPIIRKMQIPATLFIYTDFIGAPAAMNWSQLNEMAASGLVDIQSHAKSHTSLAPLPLDETEAAHRQRVRSELRDSNQILKRKLSGAATHLSYPYGDVDAIAATVVQEEGFSLAATVTRGDNSSFVDPYFLHRTMIYDSHSFSDFKTLLRTFRQKSLQ